MNVSAIISNPQFETRHCDKHGEFQAAVLPNGKSASCPECFNQSLRQSIAFEIDALVEDNTRRARAAQIAAIGIPEKYLHKSMNDYRVLYRERGQENVLAQARRFIAEFPVPGGKAFGLIGSTGTGKTHLAAVIAAAVASKGYSARFVSILTVLRSVKATYAQGATISEEDAITSFCDPDLLVIDDMGVKMESETDRAIIYEIVNRRNLAGGSMVFTSNLDTETLTTALGSRVLSRLCENDGEIYLCQWPDYRTTGGAA